MRLFVVLALVVSAVSQSWHIIDSDIATIDMGKL